MRQVISITMDGKVLAKLDLVRGKEKRSRYLERVVVQSLIATQGQTAEALMQESTTEEKGGENEGVTAEQH